jgi:hypothetical protein
LRAQKFVVQSLSAANYIRADVIFHVNLNFSCLGRSPQILTYKKEAIASTTKNISDRSLQPKEQLNSPGANIP